MRYVALLRSVNVGGRNRVPMAELRKLISSRGFSEVATHLQSGNAVFAGPDRPESEVEAELGQAVEAQMGVKTEFFVRLREHMAAIVRDNPFPEEAVSDPSHLVVVFTKEPPLAGSAEKLQGAITGRESVRRAGDHVYASYPDGIGESKLTVATLEKFLGSPATARNWNTVLKLTEMAGGS